MYLLLNIYLLSREFYLNVLAQNGSKNRFYVGSSVVTCITGLPIVCWSCLLPNLGFYYYFLSIIRRRKSNICCRSDGVDLPDLSGVPGPNFKVSSISSIHVGQKFVLVVFLVHWKAFFLAFRWPTVSFQRQDVSQGRQFLRTEAQVRQSDRKVSGL